MVLRLSEHVLPSRRGVAAAGTAIALLGAGALPAAPATTLYRAELSSVAHTMATRANVLGKGAAQATLAGKTLTVSGSYEGLPSAATKAHLKAGLTIGTPGMAIADLAVTGGTSGQLSGAATLTAAQLASLKAGGASIVIDSVKAPDGNLWGWLAPAEASP